ncbi:MAG TPA: tetratricopeptide repeat protein [Burkholderiales bacterium]
MPKRTLYFLGALFASTPALPVLAQTAADEAESPAIAEARQRMDVATAAFERGEYAVSLTEFERVYALLEGHPRRAYVLYNMARANQELGRDRAALALFERYLAEAGPDAPNRTEAQRHVRELRLRLELDAQQQHAPAAEPARTSDEPAGSPTSSGFSPSPLGIAVASVGLAAVVAGAIVGGVALAQDSSARADCDERSCTPEAYASLVDAHTLANAADGLLWGGLGVLAVGAVLTFVLAETGRSETAAASCDPRGCMAVLRGSY